MPSARGRGAGSARSKQNEAEPRYPWVPWAVRVLWAVLPFTVGPVLGQALEAASGPVRLLASAGLWAGWAVGMVAAAVPHPVALTALRVLAPAAVAAVVAAAVAGRPSAVALGWSVVVMAWSFSPSIGAQCVNGPAYPNERRHLLRAPGVLLAGPLVLAWALALAGLCAGPLLLAARQWAGGAAAVVLGVPVAVVLLRSLHNLSRRWAVFVPAGLVLHDPLSLLDPVLFQRKLVAHLGPARPGGGGLDLSQRAPGLALELVLTEPVPLVVVAPGHRLGRPESATRLVFTPTRPGAVLDDARTRRIRVG